MARGFVPCQERLAQFLEQRTELTQRTREAYGGELSGEGVVN